MPGNIDTATGIASGAAGGALGWWIYRRRKEEECQKLGRQCQESRKAAAEAEQAAKEARAKADEANKSCAEARKASQAAERELAELDDGYLDKSWAESEGRRITRRDLKLKRDASKAAWQRYRRGEITAQQLEAEWRRLETPEALEELRKKDSETRGEQKALAERKLAEAKAKEEEACKAADPALEKQAKEAEAKAAELKKTAEADCKAAAECDRSLEEMGPEPKEPEGETRTLPVDTEPEQPPREQRCAAQEAAVNRAQGRFDALQTELTSALHILAAQQDLKAKLRARADALEKETEKLWSEVTTWDWLWMTGSYKRYRAKEDEWQRALREYWSLSDRVQERLDTVQRLRSRAEEANAELRRAQNELARCMGWADLPEARADTNTTMTTTTEREQPGTGQRTPVFGPRRGE